MLRRSLSAVFVLQTKYPSECCKSVREVGSPPAPVKKQQPRSESPATARGSNSDVEVDPNEFTCVGVRSIVEPDTASDARVDASCPQKMDPSPPDTPRRVSIANSEALTHCLQLKD